MVSFPKSLLVVALLGTAYQSADCALGLSLTSGNARRAAEKRALAANAAAAKRDSISKFRVHERILRLQEEASQQRSSLSSTTADSSSAITPTAPARPRDIPGKGGKYVPAEYHAEPGNRPDWLYVFEYPDGEQGTVRYQGERTVRAAEMFHKVAGALNLPRLLFRVARAAVGYGVRYVRNNLDDMVADGRIQFVGIDAEDGKRFLRGILDELPDDSERAERIFTQATQGFLAALPEGDQQGQ